MQKQRAEVHMIAPSWSFSMLSWDQISELARGRDRNPSEAYRPAS